MRRPRLLVAVLLAVLVAPWAATLAPAQEAPPPWQKTDPSNDATVTDTGSPPATATFADIQGFSIRDEDELGFTFVLALSDFETGGGTPVLWSQGGFRINFEIPTAPTTYHVDVGTWGSMPTTGPAQIDGVGASLCVDYGKDCGDPDRIPLFSAVDYQNNLLRVRVLKADLLGKPSTGTPTSSPASRFNVGLGSQLTNFVITSSQTTLFGPPEVRDRMPDEGTIEDPYAFALPRANGAVAVTFDGNVKRLGLMPGTNQSVTFTVSNVEGPKRLLSLTYSLTGEAANVGAYRIHGPSNVTVPSASQRILQVFIETPDPVKPVQLSILARSLVDSDVGLATVDLTQGMSLPPGPTLLHFFREPVGDRGPEYLVFDRTFCDGSCIDWGILSPASSVTGFESSGRVSMRPWNREYTFETQFPTALPIAFSPQDPIEIKLGIRTDNPETSTISMGVTLEYGKVVLLSQEKSFEVPPGGTTVTFKSAARTSEILPAQSSLGLRFSGGRAEGSPVDRLFHYQVEVSESQLTLPLVEVPKEINVPDLASPFQVAVLNDGEKYVNRGEARLFNVSVLNYGATPQRLTLSSFQQPSGWTVEFLPGRVFEIRPGGAIVAGVLVRPREGAVEGERAFILLNATATDGSINQLVLHAVLTQADAPDDTHAFVVDQESDANRADRPRAGTPGVPAVGALALVGLAAAWGRRRLRGSQNA